MHRIISLELKMANAMTESRDFLYNLLFTNTLNERYELAKKIMDYVLKISLVNVNNTSEETISKKFQDVISQLEKLYNNHLHMDTTTSQLEISDKVALVTRLLKAKSSIADVQILPNECFLCTNTIDTTNQDTFCYLDCHCDSKPLYCVDCLRRIFTVQIIIQNQVYATEKPKINKRACFKCEYQLCLTDPASDVLISRPGKNFIACLLENITQQYKITKPYKSWLSWWIDQSTSINPPADSSKLPDITTKKRKRTQPPVINHLKIKVLKDLITTLEVWAADHSSAGI